MPIRENEAVSIFVRDATASGASPADVREALKGAGWGEASIQQAMMAWERVPGLPPVPVRSDPAPRLGARYALLLILTLWVLGGVGSVLFWMIDNLVIDPTDMFPSMTPPRWTIAGLIVAAPAAFFLARKLRKISVLWARDRDPAWFRGWLMVIASLIILCDAVAAVYGFLSGDLSSRFLLKAAVAFSLAGVVVSVLRADRHQPSFPISIIGLIMALGVSLAAVVVSGGPGEGRQERRDAIRMSDVSALSENLVCLLEAKTACALIPPREADPFTGEPYEVRREPGRVTVCAMTESRIHRTSPDRQSLPGCASVTFDLNR